MKKTTTYLLLALGILSLGVSYARTWTSADGSQTFRGEFVSYNKETNVVKVIKGLKTVTFKADKLSELDQEWLKEQGSAGEADKAAADAAKALAAQKIGSKLKEGVLSKLEDGAFVDHTMTTAPEYYVVYYSGSW